MAEELEIIISANVDKAREGLNGVASDAAKTADSLNKIPAAANGASSGLDKIAVSAAAAGPATAGASTGTQKLVSSLVKLPPLANTSADATKKFVTQLKETNSVLLNVASGTPKATQQIVKLQIGVSKLGDTLETLKAKRNVTSDLINTERDTTKVAILQKQLEQLEAEILRVQSIGKQGIIPSEVSEQAFSGIISGASQAFSALRKIAFILPGIGVAGILGGLSDAVISLGKELFNLADSFDQAEVQAAQFQNQLKSLNDFIESTKGELDFSSEIAKLKNQLTLGPGFKTDILGKAIDVKTAEEKLKNLNTVVDIQFNKLNHLLGNATNVLSKEGKKLFDSFGGVPDLISDELIQKLTKNDQTFLNNAKSISVDIEKLTKERGEAERQIEILNTQKQVDVHNQQLKEQKEFHDKQLKEANDFLQKVNQQTIALAREAEKVFAVPLTLKFDDTDLDLDKLNKATKVLAGIKDFTIKARVDIVLPDIKELPREQVDKFFVQVPNALRDAINKGLIEVPKDQKVLIDAEVGPFSKEIQDEIDKFNREGFKIPVTFDLKDADLVAKLRESFKGFQDAVNSVKKISFKELLDQLQKAGAIGKEAGKQTEEAFLKSGHTAEEAAAAGRAMEETFHGISKGAAESAVALNSLLTPAFQNLFSAILQGKDPLQAFFKSLIQGVEQLISKLIAAAVEAAILAAISGGASSFGSLFGKLLGFAEGGQPPVNKPSIVGEKGWEIFVPKVPGTIISHEKSVQLLTNSVKTDSVKENETVKEYLIATRVSQQLKTHFTELIRPIQATVNNISSTHEKISSFSYKLHENVKSLKESFVSSVATNNNSEINNVSSSISRSIEKLQQSFTNNNEVNNSSSIVTDSISKSIDRIKESFASSLITNKEVNNNDSSVSSSIEKLQKSLSAVNNSKVSNSDSLREATQILKESLSSEVNRNTSSLINKAVEKIAESLVINNTEVSKSTEQNNISSLITRSIEHLKESSNKFSSVKYSIEKLQQSFIVNTKEVFSDKLTERFEKAIKFEKVNDKVTVNSLTKSAIPSNKFTDKFQSFHVEKIINNNFFTESISSSFKSMSLERLQKMFNIPAFATGGAVFGPTLAILGEGFGISRSNPEFVGTANQLQNVTGGQFDLNLTLNGSLETTGDKLWTFLNRTSKTHLRTTGKKPL